MSKLKKEKEECDEGRTTCSLHDFSLDESGEDTSHGTEETEQPSDNPDLSEISNDDENSDSYVKYLMLLLLTLMKKKIILPNLS